jgi:hypothetical protein
MAAGFRAIAAGVLLGCAANPQRVADLQLELGPQPEGAAQVRICVAGVGERTVGARLTGLYALPGLPADAPLDVWVDVLDPEEELLVQGSTRELDGWAQGVLADCTITVCTPCAAEGGFSIGEEDWLLVVRFSQD